MTKPAAVFCQILGVLLCLGSCSQLDSPPAMWATVITGCALLLVGGHFARKRAAAETGGDSG